MKQTMFVMRTLILTSLMFLLFGCAGQPKGGKGASGEASGGDTSVTSTDGDFYKRYSGTIAGKAVVVHLHRYAGGVQGVYSYKDVGQDITLRDWSDTLKDDGIFCLNEIAPEDMPEEEGAGPSWSLQIEGANATGTWRSADGQQEAPITLTEDYSDGSTRLDAFRQADSAALWTDRPNSPVARASYGYLLPHGLTGGFLYDALRAQIAPAAPANTDVPSAIKTAMAEYFAGYRQENADAKVDPGSELEAFSFSYTDDKAMYVHYNDDNWLVTEVFRAYYTGGVHGNFGSTFANIDLAQKRFWKLMDIVTDSAALRPALNDAAIDYFNLKPGQDMEQRMLVDEVPPTGNVYVGPKGLSFVYLPYEIASYADGQVTLYIPYAKILPLLTPPFRERMHLGDHSGVAMNPFRTKKQHTWSL